MARFIAAKDFLSAKQKAAVVTESTLWAADPTRPHAFEKLSLGQIIGVVYAVTPKSVTRPSGAIETSLQAQEEFEGIVFDSGEVLDSNVAYLPPYFAELLQGMLKQNSSGGVSFAAEILVRPTGKNIPYSYEMKSLMPASRLLTDLKKGLAKRGLLKLPPPSNDELEGQAWGEGEPAKAIADASDTPHGMSATNAVADKAGDKAGKLGKAHPKKAA